tara:strand:+ start:28 stop:300 length:273 start_codon:yes stop_codon:yes gene_type:complete
MIIYTVYDINTNGRMNMELNNFHIDVWYGEEIGSLQKKIAYAFLNEKNGLVTDVYLDHKKDSKNVVSELTPDELSDIADLIKEGWQEEYR